MGWFRLLAGGHECSDPDWEPLPTDPPDKKPPSKTYKPGDVFFDDSLVDGKNLSERFGYEKFQYLGEEEPRRVVRTPPPAPRPELDIPPAEVHEMAELPPPPPPVPNFDAMSMAEMKAYAEAEEVDISNCKGRAATVKRLKESRTNKHPT